MADLITSTVAKEADGTIQITFSLPWPLVKKAQAEVLVELAKDIEVPGFRKGKAPVAKAAERIAKETLIQKVVASVLPKALGEAIVKHKVSPAIYPRLEVIGVPENEPWQIRATTCELPQIELGNYKEAIVSAAKAKIIVPGAKEATKEEKEQEVLKILLSLVNIKLPHLLVHEEADARLSSLLDRIEKLGLTLESYLASIGKTPETIRQDYEKQASETLTYDLILDKIAQQEKVTVDEAKVDEVIKASSADASLQKKLDTPEQRRLIHSILRRRASLDSLTALL